ncbi:hypothetical protein UUU_25430 (plasmid) [Klebsiella pneumoniae subsp. pneumoniae DSM 30104 = JCM 1662 = NBRC 14940]|nr:hypothetical protein UUU_25430 [Klebsiella pneumoniae subsp. pneumoniae DSM 30104 = JCM 1662 = NBRC 14940]
MNWSKQPPAVEAKPVKVGCPETDGDHSQLNRSLLPLVRNIMISG